MKVVLEVQLWATLSSLPMEANISTATFPRRGDEDRNDLDFFAMVTLQRLLLSPPMRVRWKIWTGLFVWNQTRIMNDYDSLDIKVTTRCSIRGTGTQLSEIYSIMQMALGPETWLLDFFAMVTLQRLLLSPPMRVRLKDLNRIICMESNSHHERLWFSWH